MENTITLPISKKVFTIREPMTFPEVRQARKDMKALLEVINKVQGRAPTQEEITILTNKTEAQDEIVAKTLLKRFDIKEEDLNVPYSDALFAYSKLFEYTITPPKN